MAATREDGDLTQEELQGRFEAAWNLVECLRKAKPGSEEHAGLLRKFDKLIPTGIYEHYKSTPERPKRYIVLGVGNDRKSGECSVICIALYPPYDGLPGHAPVVGKRGFLQPVTGDGKAKPRFRWQGPLKMSFEDFLKANEV